MATHAAIQARQVIAGVVVGAHMQLPALLKRCMASISNLRTSDFLTVHAISRALCIQWGFTRTLPLPLNAEAVD